MSDSILNILQAINTETIEKVNEKVHTEIRKSPEQMILEAMNPSKDTELNESVNLEGASQVSDDEIVDESEVHVAEVEDNDSVTGLVHKCRMCGAYFAQATTMKCPRCGDSDIDVYGEVYSGDECEGFEGFEMEELLVELPNSKGRLQVTNESKSTPSKDDTDIESEEELTESVKSVVKGGRLVKVKVRTKKKKMTTKQKQALKKAQKKSHTASANKARAKSMRVRKKKLGESVREEGYIVSVRLDDKILDPTEGYLESISSKYEELVSEIQGSFLVCEDKTDAMECASVLFKECSKSLKGSGEITVQTATGRVVDRTEFSGKGSLSERVMKIHESLSSKERPGIAIISDDVEDLEIVAISLGFEFNEESNNYTREVESCTAVIDTAEGDLEGVVLYAVNSNDEYLSEPDLQDLLDYIGLELDDDGFDNLYESTNADDIETNDTDDEIDED